MGGAPRAEIPGVGMECEYFPASRIRDNWDPGESLHCDLASLVLFLLCAAYSQGT